MIKQETSEKGFSLEWYGRLIELESKLLKPLIREMHFIKESLLDLIERRTGPLLFP